ncbi:hypothetical protein B0T25DRAFT_518599 [Lasiosphaeria hispida]|uniref:Uncharacterized protein n=1 Tax=Lasiosphaeria hispida TaxID=260671 RepID=A0AAJ0HJA5_9PEZI|nr:hypothetical protein B0T25DRAFT_518599 [Lasiosphaeria hispida]
MANTSGLTSEQHGHALEYTSQDSTQAVPVFGIETGKSSFCGPEHKSERDELLRTLHSDVPGDRMCHLCRGSLQDQLDPPDAEDSYTAAILWLRQKHSPTSAREAELYNVQL